VDRKGFYRQTLLKTKTQNNHREKVKSDATSESGKMRVSVGQKKTIKCQGKKRKNKERGGGGKTNRGKKFEKRVRPE